MKIKKKRDCIFYRSRKCPKWRNPRWPPTYIKINIFTNNFAATYARDIHNMSIVMFSGKIEPFFFLNSWGLYDIISMSNQGKS